MGVRTVYGELQVMANNNGADAANSQGVSSTKWMAISADDGSYITPDGSGTTANSVKLDICQRAHPVVQDHYHPQQRFRLAELQLCCYHL